MEALGKMSLIEAPWSLQGTSKRLLSDCCLVLKPFVSEVRMAASLHLIELWRWEETRAVLCAISSTLWAERSDCVVTARHAGVCAAYTTQDGTNHLPEQSTADFWNFFLTFLLSVLLLFTKNIAEGQKVSVCCSSISSSKRKKDT